MNSLHVMIEIMTCGLKRDTKASIEGLVIPHSVEVERPSLSQDFTRFANWQLNASSLGCNFDVKVTSAPAKRKYRLVADRPLYKDSYDLIIMYGCGIDSTVAIWYAHALNYPRVLAIHVDNGSPYREKEKQVASKLFKQFDVPASLFSIRLEDEDEKPYGPITESEMGKGYIIPNRNAVYAAIGAIFAPAYSVKAGADIWIVANYRKIDDEPGAAVDKNRRFYAEVSYLLSKMHKQPIRVTSPFLHMTKAASIEWFIDYVGRDYALEVLRATTTCYHPTEQRCARCYACSKLAMALEPLGLYDEFFDRDIDPVFMQEFVAREKAKGRKIPARWEK